MFGFIAREEPSLLLHCQAIRTIPLKRTQHKTVGYLEENEMQALFSSVKIESRNGTRDNALLLVLYNTGSRVSEIVNLKLTDLRLEGTAQVNLLGKGNKYRVCPLWPETVEALHNYLIHRNAKDPSSQHLFLNANGLPITRFGLRHIIGKCTAAAQIKCPSLNSKKVNPHTIRHTTAMHLLRSGNDINMVSYWLGHASTNTTHVYVEIDMKMKLKMLQNTKAPDIQKPLPWQKPGVLEWLNTLKKSPQLCVVNNLGR
jgi:site-specific recombinase XerD